MKKLLYFLKIIVIQDILSTIMGYITSYFNREYEYIDISVDGFLLSLIYGIGILGLLFSANAICVMFMKKKVHIYLVITLNITFYVFVFFEYVLDISGAFRELLVPTIFGVYGGVYLAMLKIKN